MGVTLRWNTPLGVQTLCWSIRGATCSRFTPSRNRQANDQPAPPASRADSPNLARRRSEATTRHTVPFEVWRRPAAVDGSRAADASGTPAGERARAACPPSPAHPARSRRLLPTADQACPPRRRRARGLLGEPLRAALARPSFHRAKAVLAQHTTAVVHSRPLANARPLAPQGGPRQRDGPGSAHHRTAFAHPAAALPSAIHYRALYAVAGSPRARRRRASPRPLQPLTAPRRRKRYP